MNPLENFLPDDTEHLKTVDYGVDHITKYLPHRDPMLLIDRVLAYNENEIYAVKTVPSDAFYFQGHFPDNPILPGVILVEMMAQAGALVAALGGQFDQENSLLAFAGVENAKFRKSVYPNETVCVYAKIVKQRQIMYKFEGYALVNGVKVAQTRFGATKIPKQRD